MDIKFFFFEVYYGDFCPAAVFRWHENGKWVGECTKDSVPEG